MLRINEIIFPEARGDQTGDDSEMRGLLRCNNVMGRTDGWYPNMNRLFIPDEAGTTSFIKGLGYGNGAVELKAF